MSSSAGSARCALHAAFRKALGIAVPGLATGTTCSWIPNLPFLDGVDLKGLFPDMTIGLGNDAQIATLAEAKAGAAKGLTDVVMLAIGTASGRRCWSMERSWPARGAAPVPSDGLARISPTKGRIATAGWSASHRAVPWTNWRRPSASAPAPRSSLPPARAIPRRWPRCTSRAKRIGTSLAGAVALLDPQLILIAGGLTDALDMLEEPILRFMRRQLPPHLRAIELRAGAFGSRAGLIGAALAGAAGEGWRRAA